MSKKNHKKRKSKINKKLNETNNIQKSKLIILRTVTPMHVGASEGSGIVDNPIQREASTNIPKVESSSLKGSLKQCCENKLSIEEIRMIFGDNNSGGQVAFTDLKLLFFPLKSSRNIFSLITCPYILERFFEETILYKTEHIENLKDLIDGCKNINNDNAFVISNLQDKEVYLENYQFKLKQLNSENKYEFKNCQWLKDIINRIVIISNDNFVDFVSYYTEVVTRNKINESTGTTEDTGLYTEEYIPSEAIFYGIVSRFDNILDEKVNSEGKKVYKEFIANFSNNKYFNKFQLGGNSTLGKGIVKIIN